MNRMRVWFEQGKIVFPYGNHDTRKIIDVMLNELETHVWKGGDIIDLGKHNDMAMALAHAIDCFSHRDSVIVPIAVSKTESGWSKGKKGGGGGKPPSPGKYVGLW